MSGAASRSRRRLLQRALAATGAALLAGCDRPMRPLLARANKSAEWLSRCVHRALAGRRAMAQEFTPADVQQPFRSNGTRVPPGAAYKALADGGFAAWRLQVDGLVDVPASYSLNELRALPARSQITRHDCVEGWSCIGQWKGVPLAVLLERARPRPAARYVVFHCADAMDEGDPRSLYYESIDFYDAYHPQTILAYELNGAPLPVANGAPLRARIERQLGYKHAKYVMHIELVESLRPIRGGQGGYWEDLGYEWYAGI